MDYEKAYKEALEWVRDVYPTLTGASKEDAEHFFPELAESEDERIRKEIIEYLWSISNQTSLVKESLDCRRWIAYLEKQKINTDGDFARGYDCGYECCLHSHGAEWFEKQKEQDKCPKYCVKSNCVDCPIYEKQKEQNIYKSSKSEIDFADRYSRDVWEKLMSKFKAIKGYSIGCNDVSDIVLNAILNAFKWQKEQKPAEWSEEDESNLQSCIAKIEIDMQHWFKHGKTMVDGDIKLIEWLNSLPERFELQPKQEWDEKDKNKLYQVMETLIADKTIAQRNYPRCKALHKAYDELIDWLKYLRPQSHWKPSEEQMEALKWSLEILNFGTLARRGAMESLYAQLDKLM